MHHPEDLTLAERKPPALSLGRKLVLFSLIGIAALFLIVVVFPYFNINEAFYGRYWPYRLWLVAHVCAGIVAMSVGLFQLWTGLGGVRMTIHPWTGRVYGVATLLGSISAFALARGSLEAEGLAFAMGLSGLAVAWLITTGMAVLAIRRGHVGQHKEWMVRSYVVTFAFVTFRVVSLSLAALGVADATASVTIASWFCWAVPLLLVEAFIQGRKIMRPSSAS